MNIQCTNNDHRVTTETASAIRQKLAARASYLRALTPSGGAPVIRQFYMDVARVTEEPHVATTMAVTR